MTTIGLIFTIIGSIVGFFLLCGLIAFLMIFVKQGIFNVEYKSDSLVITNNPIGAEIEATRVEILEKCQNVTIKANNGKTINGLYLYNKNATKNIILVHGYRGLPEIDFAPAFKYLKDNNFNILLIHQQPYYPNTGCLIGMGLKEKEDILPWVNYVETLNELPIYLWGQSMGTFCILSNLEGLQSTRVKGVIADCGFYNVYHHFMDTMNRRIHFPPLSFLIVVSTGFWVSLILHKSIFANSTLPVVEKNDIPTLFVHGKSDPVVDYHQTIKNYEHNKGEKDLLLSEKANHLASFIFSKEEYISKLNTLFKW